MKTKSVSVRVKAGPDAGLEEGQFSAYASTFTREPDSYGDVVAKGAFEKSLAEWAESGSVLPVLWGHDTEDPFANIGGVLSASEDDHGLLVTGQLDLGVPKADQVYRLLKGKRVGQMSFAFDVISAGQVELEDGRKANELRELRLYEVSVVPIGANQDTEVLAVKAAVDALTEGVKAGRVLSAKNEAAIADATAEITGAAERLTDILVAVRGGAEDDDQGKASGHTDAKDEEPAKAKSEEPRVNPSARALADLSLLAHIGQEGAWE